MVHRKSLTRQEADDIIGLRSLEGFTAQEESSDRDMSFLDSCCRCHGLAMSEAILSSLHSKEWGALHLRR